MPCVVVYGGAGQLGSVIVQRFVEGGWTTISVDYRSSDKAQHSITLKSSGEGDLDTQNGEHVVEEIKKNKWEIDVVISVAGGFQMGGIKNSSIFAETEKMLSMNVKSSIAASFVAANTLKENGLLVLSGAAGCFSPTPALIAYGVSKAATHHLVKSLAQVFAGYVI